MRHWPHYIRRGLTMADQKEGTAELCLIGLSRPFGGPRSDLLLLANRGQLEMFLLDERIFGCFGKMPILSAIGLCRRVNCPDNVVYDCS